MSKSKRILVEKKGEGRGLSAAIKILQDLPKEKALNELRKMLSDNVEECSWYETAVKAEIREQNRKALAKRSGKNG